MGLKLILGRYLLHISIFENGRLYEMKGENLYDEEEILTILYGLAIGKFHIILSKFQEISRVLPKKHGLFLQEV